MGGVVSVGAAVVARAAMAVTVAAADVGEGFVPQLARRKRERTNSESKNACCFMCALQYGAEKMFGVL